jgi:hypothetical protein
MTMPTEVAECDCANERHDRFEIGGDVHFVCRACHRSVAIIKRQAIHRTAASTPGIKGGGSHSGRDLERGADALAVALGGCAAVLVLGILARCL